MARLAHGTESCHVKSWLFRSLLLDQQVRITQRTVLPSRCSSLTGIPKDTLKLKELGSNCQPSSVTAGRQTQDRNKACHPKHPFPLNRAQQTRKKIDTGVYTVAEELELGVSSRDRPAQLPCLEQCHLESWSAQTRVDYFPVRHFLNVLGSTIQCLTTPRDCTAGMDVWLSQEWVKSNCQTVKTGLDIIISHCWHHPVFFQTEVILPLTSQGKNGMLGTVPISTMFFVLLMRSKIENACVLGFFRLPTS